MSRLTMAAAALSLFSAVTAPASALQQTSSPSEALDGVDVVILVQQGKEVFGKSAHRAGHDGLDYLFSTPETKAEFEKAPARYAAQFGGMCARMGGSVTANPSDYVLHEGRIYLFGSDACRKAFIASPEKFIPRAPEPWPAGDAAARGRALLEKAAAGHGGGALDAAKTYSDSVTTLQKRPTGDVSIVTRTLRLFPSSVRTERTLPLNQGPQTFVTVVTPTEVWGSGQGRINRPQQRQLSAIRTAAFRSVLPLLKMRQDPSLKAAALGTGSVDAVAVDRVRVARGELDVTLNLDPATGRTHSIAFYDRAENGYWADIVVTFEDYREIEGVQVPFVERATANGAPSPQLSKKLESAAINGPLDPALFVMPKGAGQ
jgi:YHS domain-containing protein